MGKKPDIDNVLDGFQQDVINGSDYAEPSLLDTVDTSRSVEEKISDSWSNIPPDEGYFIKIYKKHPLPEGFGNNPMLLKDIQNPELINDYESELLRLAQKNNWGDGIYVLRLFQVGNSKKDTSQTIAIKLPKEQLPEPISSVTNNNQTDNFESFQKTLSLVKDMYGDKQQTPPPTENMADTIKALGEIYKNQTPNQSNQPNIAELIIAMKEVMTPAPLPEQPNMLEMLKIVMAMNKPSQPTADPIEMLTKLKELTPEVKPVENPMEGAMKMLTTIMPLVEKMSEGKGDGNTSTAVELIRTLGPQLGKAVSDITGTINTVAGAKAKQQKVNKPSEAMVTPVREGQVSTPAKVEGPMLPVFESIKTAVINNDVNFFPELDELVSNVTTASQYNDLIDKKMNPMNILQQVAKYSGNEFFLSPPASAYFTKYIDWKRMVYSEEEQENMTGQESTLVETPLQEVTNTLDEGVGIENGLPVNETNE